jgi:hypothetical protein
MTRRRRHSNRFVSEWKFFVDDYSQGNDASQQEIENQLTRVGSEWGRPVPHYEFNGFGRNQ